MNDAYKPLLAVDAGGIENVKMPCLASPKLDGVRAAVKGVENDLLSRKLKKIPNHYTRSLFENSRLRDLDGELIVGPPTGEVDGVNVYNRTVSGVMTHEGEPDVFFYVFDWSGDPTMPYIDRLDCMRGIIDKLPRELLMRVVPVPTKLIATIDELKAYEEECVQAGYEGVMVRSLTGRYKFGRSTLKEGILLKVKRFADMEATIVGFTEKYSNQNEATIDELGHTKRSSHQENMVPTGTLGALVCSAENYEFTFDVGTGFTAKMREDFWNNREQLMGRMIKIKYQPSGEKDRPRFPVFLGFRYAIDL